MYLLNSVAYRVVNICTQTQENDSCSAYFYISPETVTLQ